MPVRGTNHDDVDLPSNCDKICTSNGTRWASRSSSLGRRPAPDPSLVQQPRSANEKLLAATGSGSSSITVDVTRTRTRRRAVSGGSRQQKSSKITLSDSEIFPKVDDPLVNGEISEHVIGVRPSDKVVNARHVVATSRSSGGGREEEEGTVDEDVASDKCMCRCLSTHPAFREDTRDCVARFSGTHDLSMRPTIYVLVAHHESELGS
jgi:hypothetical protein